MQAIDLPPIVNCLQARPPAGIMRKIDPMAGVVTLGEVALLLASIEVGCNRCDRRERLSTARLLAQHGAHLPIPELRRIVAADCSRMIEAKMHDVCGVLFPGLVGVA